MQQYPKKVHFGENKVTDVTVTDVTFNLSSKLQHSISQTTYTVQLTFKENQMISKL